MLKVGLHDVVIPAGQVRHVKCKIPSTLDTSNPLVLLETSDNNPQLQQLDVRDSLLVICQAKVPYVKVPIGNHTKHDVTLYCKTVPRAVLQYSIEPISRIVQTELNQAESNVAQEVSEKGISGNSAEQQEWGDAGM